MLRPGKISMKRLVAFGLITLSFVIKGEAQGVKFREDLSWEQLKVAAKAEHKDIFLDVMATWCSPCKAMEQSVYPDTALGKFMDGSFISVKVQSDQTKNDSKFVKSWYVTAKMILNRYQVTGLPSMVFLTPEGQLLYKSVGFRSKDELISDAKRALNPASRYDLMMGQYFKGKSDQVFLEHLIRQTDSVDRKIMAQKIAYESLGHVKDSTAYGVLSNLSKKKSGKLVAKFSGNWEIDYQACEFGDKPLRAAAKKLGVLVFSTDMEITRLTAGADKINIQSKETLSLAGKLSSSITSTENRKKHSRLFISPDGQSFTEFSEYTFSDDRSIDYVGVEEWSLLPDGKLLVSKTAYTNGGSYKLKLVYKKS